MTPPCRSEIGVGNPAVLVVASRIRKFAEDTEFLLSGVRKCNVAATQEADLHNAKFLAKY